MSVSFLQGVSGEFCDVHKVMDGFSRVRQKSLCLCMVDYILRESQTTHNVLWSRASVCLSGCLFVCLSVCGRTPTLLHGPGCNLGAW